MSNASTDDPLRIEARKLGIPIRKDLATTLTNHDVTGLPGMVNITDRISKNITGKRVRDLRKLFGIVGRKTPRDHIKLYELIETFTSEKKIDDHVKNNNIRGDRKCLTVSDEISRKVHEAFENMRAEVKKIA